MPGSFHRLIRNLRKIEERKVEMEETYEAGTARPIKETEKALLVHLDGVGETWVPKWAIHDDSEVWKEDQEPGELVVLSKFASKEGWL